MTTPATREVDRLRKQIEALERELDHRANIIAEQADELAALRDQSSGLSRGLV